MRPSDDSAGLVLEKPAEIWALLDGIHRFENVDPRTKLLLGQETRSLHERIREEAMYVTEGISVKDPDYLLWPKQHPDFCINKREFTAARLACANVLSDPKRSVPFSRIRRYKKVAKSMIVAMDKIDPVLIEFKELKPKDNL